jgi:hypothetical protein
MKNIYEADNVRAGDDEPRSVNLGLSFLNGTCGQPAACSYGSVADAFATDRSRPQFQQFARRGLNLVYHLSHNRKLRAGKLNLTATALNGLKVAQLTNPSPHGRPWPNSAHGVPFSPGNRGGNHYGVA